MEFWNGQNEIRQARDMEGERGGDSVDKYLSSLSTLHSSLFLKGWW